MNIYLPTDLLLFYPNIGVSVYNFHLLKEFSKIEDVTLVSKFSSIRYTLHKKLKHIIKEYGINIELSSGYYPGKLDKKLGNFEKILTIPKEENFDLAHRAGYFISESVISTGKPYILTIHDMAGFVDNDIGFWPKKLTGTIDKSQIKDNYHEDIV